MKAMVLLLLLIPLGMCSAQSSSITRCEWFVGADPGIGAANPLSIGSPADHVDLAFALSTGSFPSLFPPRFLCPTPPGNRRAKLLLYFKDCQDQIRVGFSFPYSQRLPSPSWSQLTPKPVLCQEIFFVCL